MSEREQVEAARKRLFDGKYMPWTDAGGPNECKHGYAEGIPCRRCDEELASLLPAQVSQPVAAQDEACDVCATAKEQGWTHAHSDFTKPSPQADPSESAGDCCKGLAPAHECYIACGGTKPDGSWPALCLQRSFVDGMKWWQFNKYRATAFRSEIDEAEAEAIRRYGEPSTLPQSSSLAGSERSLAERISDIGAEFGCPAGVKTLNWIRFQLQSMAILKKQAEGLCDGCSEPLEDAFCNKCLAKVQQSQPSLAGTFEEAWKEFQPKMTIGGPNSTWSYDCFKAGWSARQQYQPAGSGEKNPYVAGSYEASIWADGYQSAQQSQSAIEPLVSDEWLKESIAAARSAGPVFREVAVSYEELQQYRQREQKERRRG